MASNSPKGYKKFGDISEVALENLNTALNDSREPRVKREAIYLDRKSDKHLIFLFPKIDSDNLESNKTFIYLDCINSYNEIVFENTVIDNVRYVTDWYENFYYMIELKLT